MQVGFHLVVFGSQLGETAKVARQVPQQNPIAKKVFGPVLRELREARGWSQNDLGFESRRFNGPSYHAITKYENTGALPALHYAQALADVFEFEVGERAWFLLLAGHDPDEGEVVVGGKTVYDFAEMAELAAASKLDITYIMDAA